ncbi:MAG TPA: DUF58 domain-containing protein [Anaerolineae bacterium]|nr:DUF58 domain-containing protein [Anaerolineae bacterium]
MLTTELISQIKRIEIRTRRLVTETFAGDYQSVFKGRGMAFDEVRPYWPGDEIRSIDWNVTARMGEPYVKRYTEERELTLMLAVDASASGAFGSVQKFKQALAAEIAAVLAFAATTNNDNVGLLIFTDEVELFIPPRKGRRHVLRVIRELLAFDPRGSGTDIKLALDTVNRILKRRSIVFLVSDFLVKPETYKRPLAISNRRHDVIVIDLNDPLEEEIPAVGLIAIEDAETGERRWVDTNNRRWRKQFAARAAAHQEAKEGVWRQARVDAVRVDTDSDYVKALTSFFQQRNARINR